MTDMPGGALTMALTATKGSRKPFVVKPMAKPADTIAEARVKLTAASNEGMPALEAAWKALAPNERQALKDELPALKNNAAAKVDDGNPLS